MLSEHDSFEEHVADTLSRQAGPLCDRQVVERIVREGPEQIRELIRWGAHFDTSGDQLALGREGGHGRERIAHALGDATGKEVMRAVIERAEKAENVHLWQNTFTIDLLTCDGVCRGAIVWNHRHGKTLIWAKETILCTGGTGQLYRETTNPDVATGDGLAMAYRAGAELRDMEFVQFHPTVLYIAGSSRHLITEAMRGEGAYLIDRSGHRFMPEYDQRAELAPRDVVSWAIVSQMERTRHPSVYLELNHLDPAVVRTRFPGIAAICEKFGIDITKDRIPVRPGAHYMMGGVTIDMDCRTTLPGLWAAGEVTASGLHGANRLASNSLLEALVHGVVAGEGVSRAAAAVDDDFRALPLSNPRVAPTPENLDLIDIRNSLKSLMWRDVWSPAGCRRAQGRRREHRSLVKLRAGRPVLRSRRVGVAEHALRRTADDPECSGAHGDAGLPCPHRFSETDDARCSATSRSGKTRKDGAICRRVVLVRKNRRADRLPVLFQKHDCSRLRRRREENPAQTSVPTLQPAVPRPETPEQNQETEQIADRWTFCCPRTVPFPAALTCSPTQPSGCILELLAPGGRRVRPDCFRFPQIVRLNAACLQRRSRRAELTGGVVQLLPRAIATRPRLPSVGLHLLPSSDKRARSSRLQPSRSSNC